MILITIMPMLNSKAETYFSFLEVYRLIRLLLSLQSVYMTYETRVKPEKVLCIYRYTYRLHTIHRTIHSQIVCKKISR